MKKAVFILCFAVFVLVVGTGMVVPLLAPYAIKLGATGLSVGVLYSGFYVVRLLIGTPIGRFSDKYGPKAILTCSLLLYPLIATTYWLAGNLSALLGARLLHGLASAMMLPMAMAYMGEVSPNGQEGRYLGIYNTILFLANGVGPLLGGFIADRWGTKAAFLWLLGLAITSLALIFFALPPTTSKIHQNQQKSEIADTAKIERIATPTVNPLRHPGLMALAIINIVEAILSIFLVSFFTLFAEKQGLGLASIGFLLSLNNIVVAATQIPLGQLADRHNKYHLILLSAIATAVILLIFPVASSLWLIAVLMIVTGLTSGLTLAASSALSATLGRTVGMGSAMGFLGSATSAGMVIGPLASGWLVDHFQVESTFYFSGAVWLFGAVAFAGLWAAYRRTKGTVDAQISS